MTMPLVTRLNVGGPGKREREAGPSPAHPPNQIRRVWQQPGTGPPRPSPASGGGGPSSGVSARAAVYDRLKQDIAAVVLALVSLRSAFESACPLCLAVRRNGIAKGVFDGCQKQQACGKRHPGDGCQVNLCPELNRACFGCLGPQVSRFVSPGAHTMRWRKR
jgi:hypothetical protein